jgi:hypothetical protein
MSPLTSSSFMSFRTFLFYLLVLIGGLAFVGYVMFQARFIVEGPQIAVTNVSQESPSKRIVVLEGTASNIVHMTLNGRKIYTDASGNFKEALVLENGYTIATLEAEDRYGRTQRQTREFVYNASDASLSIINDKPTAHGI